MKQEKETPSRRDELSVTPGEQVPSILPVLIIGAGPAGLAMAGRLCQLGIPFEMVEKSEAVGAVWRGHYDRLHLHTVKELSELPHLPFPDDYPRYVPRRKLVEYMEQYAAHFDLRPHFGEEVVSVRKEGEAWVTRTACGRIFRSRAVVIGTGVNRVPNRPRFEGEEGFRGTITHSREYRQAAPFRGQRVLVVGMGNTGAEIALDLCENEAEPAISVRGPVNIVPRDFWGNSTQKTAIRLSVLPDWLGDQLGILVRRLTIGDLSPYGLEIPAIPPARQLRETGKTPVVDVGTVAQIRAGRIRVLPGIGRFDEAGVVFENGEHHPFDAVILATGYRARLVDFLDDTDDLSLDEYGVPRECVAGGRHEGLYFLGFDNYTPGGILGVIRRDSEVIAGRLQAQLAAKARE